MVFPDAYEGRRQSLGGRGPARRRRPRAQLQAGRGAVRDARALALARTGTEYPVSVRVQAGALTLEIEPLMEDQELDARSSTGTIYWEGAVRAKQGKTMVGRGYLELTGYWKPLRL